MIVGYHPSACKRAHPSITIVSRACHRRRKQYHNQSARTDRSFSSVLLENESGSIEDNMLPLRSLRPDPVSIITEHHLPPHARRTPAGTHRLSNTVRFENVPGRIEASLLLDRDLRHRRQKRNHTRLSARQSTRTQKHVTRARTGT